MSGEVNHLSLSGRLLRFQNLPGMYPVNAYQSLVLASMAEIAAMALALRQERSIRDLRAWEACCGGGPAAVTLKDLGLGFVQATDINETALEACKANAGLNGLTLDRIASVSLLEDPDPQTFDLICCNPPCGVESIISGSARREAVDGGTDGMDITIAVLRQSLQRLSSSGSLLLIVVSTGNVIRLRQKLRELFPNRWRVLSPTPVAAPWLRADDPKAIGLTTNVADFTPFVWERPDGWLWRLSWVVEASTRGEFGLSTNKAISTGFPLLPFGFEMSYDDALRKKISASSGDHFFLGETTSF